MLRPSEAQLSLPSQLPPCMPLPAVSECASLGPSWVISALRGQRAAQASHVSPTLTPAHRRRLSAWPSRDSFSPAAPNCLSYWPCSPRPSPFCFPKNLKLFLTQTTSASYPLSAPSLHSPCPPPHPTRAALGFMSWKFPVHPLVPVVITIDTEIPAISDFSRA